MRGLLVLAVILLAAYFGYRQYLSHQLARADSQLQQDHFEEAGNLFRKVMSLPGSGRVGRDGLGAIALIQGQRELAAEHFTAVLARKPSGFGADPSTVLKKLNDAGRYEDGARYRSFLQEWKQPGKLSTFALDFAAISLGLGKLEEARSCLDQVPPANRGSDRYRRLEKLLTDFSREGMVGVILDRAGNPLLNYVFDGGRYEFAMPRLFTGFEDENGKIIFLDKIAELDLHNRIQTTLDLNLQKAAFQAMKDYEGTLIITAVDNGDILAAYGTRGHNPFTFRFEPGSIIKLLTYGYFLEGGGETGEYAPKTYPGNSLIGGKIFYDWTAQGRLASVEEGMAVSCNLMFAQMGLDLSWPGLRNGLLRLFDSQSKAGFLGEGYYGFLLREPEDAWELGRVAIGLDLLQTTVLGTSLIPAAVAAGGTLPRPRLVTAYTNLEGTVYRHVAPENMGRLFSPEVADKMRDSMVAAVRFGRGTARRAQVPFVDAAMKTGTSGVRPFDSVMVGFFPAEKPKVVFALVLERGGKCEINGAKVAKRLQEEIQALAPEYLN